MSASGIQEMRLATFVPVKRELFAHNPDRNGPARGNTSAQMDWLPKAAKITSGERARARMQDGANVVISRGSCSPFHVRWASRIAEACRLLRHLPFIWLKGKLAPAPLDDAP